MDRHHTQTVAKPYRVDRRQIAFLRFLFEAYDGIATLTTLDAHTGIVMLRIAPGCNREVETVLQEIEQEILIEPVCL
jgi:hypothetical protein